ncbi:General stress protein 14 [Cedecea neteri]|uniref:General stress protein 14 n=1 Tax=Cedecea neteri TaxID=158822 RepID=A0A2X3L5E9_9ENTR|nr:General stress protein 14 [Cedecea neteri]
MAVTAGNVEEAYRPGGRNLFTIESLLAPLRATANRCGLAWCAPFVVYTADKLDAAGLKMKAEAYAQALTRWRENKL